MLRISLALATITVCAGPALAVDIDTMKCSSEFTNSKGKSDFKYDFSFDLVQQEVDGPSDKEPGTRFFYFGQHDASMTDLQGELKGMGLYVRLVTALQQDSEGKPIRAAQASCVGLSLEFDDGSYGFGCIIPRSPWKGSGPFAMGWPAADLKDGFPVMTSRIMPRFEKIVGEHGKFKLDCSITKGELGLKTNEKEPFSP